MNVNPWFGLPDAPPYVLKSDEPLVHAFNQKRQENSAHFLVLGKILPEPFVGNQSAPVVVLSNNPGLGKWELSADSYSPLFMKRMRENLYHEPSEYPFVFIAPDHNGRGRDWWDRKLRPLLTEFPREIVAKSILNVTYFPYPSRRFKHLGLRLQSQDYSFSLVRDAVSHGKVVVLMRPGREKDWLIEVPELKGYARLLRVSNPQNPSISPGNLGHDFQMVVKAIRAFAPST